MIWPLRYSTMVEHGRCANGSSSGFGVAKVVDAIMSPPKTGLLLPILSGLWRAGLADRFDIADFEDRAGGARVTCPPDCDFLPYMFGKPLDREALGFQAGDHFHLVIVDQDVLSFLLIYTTRQRRAFRFFLLNCFLRVLLLPLGRRCQRDPHGEDEPNCDDDPDCVPHYGLPFTDFKQLACQKAHPRTNCVTTTEICNPQH